MYQSILDAKNLNMYYINAIINIRTIEDFVLEFFEIFACIEHFFTEYK